MNSLQQGTVNAPVLFNLYIFNFFFNFGTNTRGLGRILSCGARKPEHT